MKKLVALMMALVTTFALVACGSTTTETSDSVEATKTEAESEAVKGGDEAGTVLVSEGGMEVTSMNGKTLEDIHIAVIQQNATAAASIQLYDALEEYAATYYPEVKYTLVNGEGDAAFQVELMDQFISQGVDAITLNAADAEVVLGSVEDAVAAGIPVVNVGAALVEELGQKNVISDNTEAGSLIMNYVCEEVLKGEGNIAILRGQDGHQATTDRTIGFEDVLANYPNINVVFNDTGEWSRDVAMNLMENWLQSGEKIDVVIAQNDEMGMGAYDAIAAVGKTDEIIVTSIDFSEGGAEYTRDGKILADVLQNAPEQGCSTFQMAVELALGNDPRDKVIPFELITQDNVGDYLKQYWPNLAK